MALSYSAQAFSVNFKHSHFFFKMWYNDYLPVEFWINTHQEPLMYKFKHHYFIDKFIYFYPSFDTQIKHNNSTPKK